MHNIVAGLPVHIIVAGPPVDQVFARLAVDVVVCASGRAARTAFDRAASRAGHASKRRTHQTQTASKRSALPSKPSIWSFPAEGCKRGRGLAL